MWKIRCHGYVPSERERVTKSFANSTVSADGASHVKMFLLHFLFFHLSLLYLYNFFLNKVYK